MAFMGTNIDYVLKAVAVEVTFFFPDEGFESCFCKYEEAI